MNVFFLLPFLSFTCHIILLLLLMSGNVHPNPGPVASSEVYYEKLTQRGRLVQCYTYSKRLHLRCSLFSFTRSKLQAALAAGAVLHAASLMLLEVTHLPTLCLPLWAPPACILLLFNQVHLVLLCQCSVHAPPSSSNFLPSFYPFCISFYLPHHLTFLTALLYFLLSFFP